MSSEEEINKELQEFLENHIKELAVRFDSVQVSVTMHDPSTDLTWSFHSGKGNWHARVNTARIFVLRADAREKSEATSEDDDE
jgi:hypothetical protein